MREEESVEWHLGGSGCWHRVASRAAWLVPTLCHQHPDAHPASPSTPGSMSLELASRPASMEEKHSLDSSFMHTLWLVNQEIEKFQKGKGKEEEKYIDAVVNKNIKLGQKILIPVKQFPKFNLGGDFRVHEAIL